MRIIVTVRLHQWFRARHCQHNLAPEFLWIKSFVSKLDPLSRSYQDAEISQSPGAYYDGVPLPSTSDYGTHARQDDWMHRRKLF